MLNFSSDVFENSINSKKKLRWNKVMGSSNERDYDVII